MHDSTWLLFLFPLNVTSAQSLRWIFTSFRGMVSLLMLSFSFLWARITQRVHRGRAVCVFWVFSFPPKVAFGCVNICSFFFFYVFFLWIFFMDFFLLNFGHRRVQRSPTRTAGREKALPHRTEWRCRFFFLKNIYLSMNAFFYITEIEKKRIHCINDRSDSERWSRSFCFLFGAHLWPFIHRVFLY